MKNCRHNKKWQTFVCADLVCYAAGPVYVLKVNLSYFTLRLKNESDNVISRMDPGLPGRFQEKVED